MHDCLFCKIVAGEIPAEKVYEDERVFAFLDIHPINRGHTLVVPKKHFENMYAMPRKEFEGLMGNVHTLAHDIKNAVSANGINIGMNNEHAAGQVVLHAHVHIIPRFSEDGFTPWHGKNSNNEEIAMVAHIIRTAMH